MRSYRSVRVAVWMTLLLGASGGTSCDLSVPPSGTAGADAATACRRSCEPGCLSGFTCVIPSALQDYTAFCASPCTTNADCGSLRCASLFNQPGTPPVCVATDVPEPCPGLPADPSWHCDFPPPSCKSANVLMRGFSQPMNRVCGTEYVFCQNGCLDAGSPGASARCQ